MLNINPDTALQLNEANQDDSGPRLSADIPVFWWQNGKKPLQKVHNVLGCGGWMTEAERFEDILGTTGRPYPSTLQEMEITTRDGADLTVFGAQHLFIAPIARRICWYDNDNKTVHMKYQTGTRHWMQMLAMFGEKLGESGFVVWGPIAISVKGYQTANVQRALGEWKKYTKPHRQSLTEKLAAGGQWPDVKTLVPETLFWMPIGSFGDTPEIEMVGKTAQSPITPVQTYTAEGAMNLEVLQSLYIGSEAQAQAAEVLESHKDWLNAWKDQANGTGASTTSTASAGTISSGNGTSPGSNGSTPEPVVEEAAFAPAPF